MSEDKSPIRHPFLSTSRTAQSTDLKRKRSPSLEGTPIPPAKRTIRRHETLWFEDGNLTVLAGDVHFRLHRGVLATHSEVFRDMFMLPPVISGGIETKEGCPVVHLVDRASDLALFFEALYGAGKKSWYNSKVSVSFVEARTILTLGMKYQVQHLVDEALHRLQQCFPATLDLWDRNLHTVAQYPPLRISLYDAVATINLSRRFSLPSLLPSAFYALAQLPKDRCLAPVYYGTDIDDSESLTPRDLKRLLGGIDTLLHMQRYAQDILVNPLTGGTCRYPDVCQDLLERLPARFMAARLTLGYDALRDYVPHIQDSLKKIPGKLCEPCTLLLMDRFNENRQRIWDELGTTFSLGTP